MTLFTGDAVRVSGVIGVLALLLVAGCAGSGSQRLSDEELDALVSDKPEELCADYRRLYKEGQRNEVLNYCRLGSHALRLGMYEEAKQAFDRALERIEVVYADSPQARKARRVWYEEGSKIFKGDPYERAMAYFYRGLLYYMDGEFDNARACFRSAQLQDAFAEDAQHRSDFAIMDYMEARCNMRLGRSDMAEESLERAANASLGRAGIGFPSLRAEDNLLVVVEIGTAPVKWGDGKHREYLRYKRGASKDHAARVFLASSALPSPVRSADLYYQASTRGGRELDYILGNQARFKESTETLGEATTQIGAGLVAYGLSEDDEDVTKAGLVVGAVGIASLILSSQAKPEADTRYWESLPDSVWLVSASVAPGTHELEVVYLDSQGTPLPHLRWQGWVEVPGPNDVEALALVKR